MFHGKSQYKWAKFTSYVKLPEGIGDGYIVLFYVLSDKSTLLHILLQIHKMTVKTGRSLQFCLLKPHSQTKPCGHGQNQGALPILGDGPHSAPRHLYSHCCHVHYWMDDHTTYVNTYMHAYMNTCINEYMHPCMHTYIHTSIHPSIFPSIHPSIHTYLHTCIKLAKDWDIGIKY